jgi:GTPase
LQLICDSPYPHTPPPKAIQKTCQLSIAQQPLKRATFVVQLSSMHRSGFVNIVGHPNVGKSTLLNALVGEKMSIITHKPQTTRHRIIGLLHGEDFQIVFSDTPGFVRKPSYKMHKSMNGYVASTFEDADMMLFVTEAGDTFDAEDDLKKKLIASPVPIILILNKQDQTPFAVLNDLEKMWVEALKPVAVHRISALKKDGTPELLADILARLPEGPAYYPKDQLTDRHERFFATEIIREKILLYYQDEIPYSCEVGIEQFSDGETKEGVAISRIRAVIFASRESQKPILIGKNGSMLKKLGSAARADLENFFERRVHLELQVKVRENWRDDDRQLKFFGYS